MDDKERQPGPESAQEAREKGAALEYDAEDDKALDQSALPSKRGNTTQPEEK